MSTSFCYVFIFEKRTCITQFRNDSLSLELSFLTVEFYVKCYVAESRSHHRENYTHGTDYQINRKDGMVSYSSCNANSQQVTLTRHRVTTCRYLSPSETAKSLSVLVSVTVRTDTPQKMTPKVRLICEPW